MSNDPVRLEYDGPACISYYEGIYPELEVGTVEEILKWGAGFSVGEKLHELIGKADENEVFRSLTRVRISIEVVDSSPVVPIVPPPDPLEVFQGPDAPDAQLK